MPNPKIDFNAHKKLSDKFALKVFFSLLWREMLLQYFPMVPLTLLILFFTQELEPDQTFVLGVYVGLAIHILSILLTNQYILNSLSRIKYRDFAVCLTKDNHVLTKMGFYDCLCWKGSFMWRQLALGLVYGFLVTGLEYFQLLSESKMINISQGVQIAILMASFVWTLKRKKAGRLILLQHTK